MAAVAARVGRCLRGRRICRTAGGRLAPVTCLAGWSWTGGWTPAGWTGWMEHWAVSCHWPAPTSYTYQVGSPRRSGSRNQECFIRDTYNESFYDYILQFDSYNSA